MKSSEFHRYLRKNGWLHIRTSGSHYIYEKDGELILFLIMGARRWERAFAKKS